MTVRIGVNLPHSGKKATAQGIVEAAIQAEAAGVSSLSATERLLWPVAPVRTQDGELGTPPDHQVVLFDTLETLTAAAVVTERVELVTAILVPFFQPPALLARRLATLDQFSNGRLIVGVGQGWMREEFDHVNLSLRRRGDGLDDHLAAVKAAWGPDPVSYSGRFYSIPESYLGPKPVRLGGPPVLLGTQSVPGIRRAARWADGILPVTSVGSRLEDLESALRFFREATNDEGRPQLDVRLRAHTRITQEPLTGDRVPCSGSIDQVRDDLLRLEKLGVSEVCLNQTQIGVPFEQQLADAVAVKQSLT